MNNPVKLLLGLFCLMATAQNAAADDFEVPPFRYEVLSYEHPACRITGLTEYVSGDIVIPDFVDFFTDHETEDPSDDHLYRMAVTEIGEWAFSYSNNCSSDIHSVTLGNNIIRICPHGFGEVGIEEITLNDGLQSIGEGAFQYNGALHKIVIPSSVTELGEAIFYANEWLETVTLGDGITEIPASTFEKCIHLHDITLPAKLNTIGAGAFFECGGLEMITFPDTLVSIDNAAFQYCGNLVDITFSRNLKSIGDRAFDSCILLQNVEFNEGLEEIGEMAFCSCGNLLDITLPESLISLGSEAFIGCTSAESLTLGGQLETIPVSAFRDCHNITEVFIPASVKSIELDAFFMAYRLERVTGCEGLQVIGNGAFSSNPDGYYDCIPMSIKEIRLTDELISIGADAFRNNNVMTELHIPDTVIEIGAGAFSWMTALTSLHLSNGLTAIPEWMCHRAENLEQILIPESVKTIGSNAFSYSGIKEITIPNSVTTIESNAFSYSGIKEIYFGRSLEKIGNNSFQECGSLTSLRIPDSVAVIEDEAFSGCWNLKDVVLGSGLTKIKPHVFDGVELETLECRALVPPTVFSETFTDWQYENTNLLVPDEALEAYGKKAYWKKFLHREVSGIEVPQADACKDYIRYDLTGRPVSTTYHGITILRYNDGTVQKQVM